MSIYENELRRFHRLLTTPAWVSYLQIIALVIFLGAIIAFGVIWWAVIYWTFKVNPTWGIILVLFTLIITSGRRIRK